jgi:hypothetical protein
MEMGKGSPWTEVLETNPPVSKVCCARRCEFLVVIQV